MDLQKFIKDRFVASIRLTFPHPTPLIGERWFVFMPNLPKGQRLYFQFLGVAKLAKATGMDTKTVGQLLLRNLDLRPLVAEVELNAQNRIDLRLIPPHKAKKEDNECSPATGLPPQGGAVGGGGPA